MGGVWFLFLGGLKNFDFGQGNFFPRTKSYDLFLVINLLKFRLKYPFPRFLGGAKPGKNTISMVKWLWAFLVGA
jgi:hypothetical protein